MMRLLPHLVACIGLFFAVLGNANASEPLPLKSILVNGYDMRYVEAGDGPPLILIHGALGDHRSWAGSMNLLASRFRVIAVDTRYYGKGDWDPSWPKFHRGVLADDVAAFIRALGAGPAHLAGWSQGSAVAHLVALRNPELVRSAYLFEGVARMPLDAAAQKAVSKKLGKVIGPVMAPLKREGPGAVAPKFFDMVAGRQGAFNDLPTASQQRIMDNARTIPLFMSTFARDAQPTATCETISQSKVPTLLVIGTATAPFFNDMFKQYEPCFGPERIERPSNADHIWPGVDSKAFVKSLTAFALSH